MNSFAIFGSYLTTTLMFGQSVITTAVGTDFAFPSTPVAAVSAPIGHPESVAADAAGNIYFADSSNRRVMKVDTKGVLTVVAGNGFSGFSGDGGPATSAALSADSGIAVDADGNLFLADSLQNRIRKVTTDGIIRTIAGNGKTGFSGDGGPAVSASLGLPMGMAVDMKGDLFFVDFLNSRVREVTPDGTITTVAGNGHIAFLGDGGPARLASLGPVDIAVDGFGDIFIADASNERVRKVTPDGIINTVAGNGNAHASGDGGPAINASVDPYGVAVDAKGDLYIADLTNNLVRKVTPDGIISTVAGNGIPAFSGDGGDAKEASLYLPVAVTLDTVGNLFIADRINLRIRAVKADGFISTVAGNGNFSFAGDTGPAINASLNFATAVALDAQGDLFIGDTDNYRIRLVTQDGAIITVAGNGIPSNTGDGGRATEASLTIRTAASAFGSLAVDRVGNVYFIAGNRIRKITPDGIINSIAGNGSAQNASGGVGDGGPATAAFLDPRGIATDATGNLYIADTDNHRIRKVTQDGIINTVAGNGGASGNLGDGGPANAASMTPTAVAVDSSGNLFIVDFNRIRRVTPDGIIRTIAGNGIAGFSGDGGPAISASVNYPNDVTVDAAGNLYIADDRRVRKVTPDGVIATIAGNGHSGFSGDGGPATGASLGPSTLAVDGVGNVFIADPSNNRVRVVLAVPPTVRVSPLALSFVASSDGARAPAQTLQIQGSIPAVPITVSSDSAWLSLGALGQFTPALIQVFADPSGLTPQTYHGTILINASEASPAVTAISVTFVVGPGMPPQLRLDKSNFSFTFPKSGVPYSQSLNISNTGSGNVALAASAATNPPAHWLSVSPTFGTVQPSSPLVLTLTADPTGMSPGTYSGTVSVSPGNVQIPVTMTISQLDQAILLSQSGLSFQSVQGGGVVPLRTVGVQNIGVGVVNWTASTSTLTGGNWLQVSPSAGSSDASADTNPRVTVSADSSALPAGAYYGLVRIDAPGSANTPQVLTVFLEVLPAGSNIPPAVQPGHLVFMATAGAESPGSQVIHAYNIVAQTKSFRSQVSADAALSLLTSPQDATLDPQQPADVVVQPITTNLNVGVHSGVVSLQFSDGTVTAVPVTVIVSNSGGASSLSRSRSADLTVCTPSKLVPALTTLAQTFSVSAGWPAALVVNVYDDCGVPMPPEGSVTVSFSNGDQPLSLISQGRGSWESTWQTGNATTGVTLNIQASSQGLTGEETVNGSLASQQQPPVFNKSTIFSAAAAVSFTALAPGSVISIYGDRLAEGAAQVQNLPLPSQLIDTQLFVTGATVTGTSTGLMSAPLYYVSQNQLNALIPYEVAIDTSLQLLVRRGTTYSLPAQIDMAEAQPAVFSNGGTPGSAGLIYVFPNNGGQPYFASTSRPAHAGDTIVLYCTGLGAVNPSVADGAAPEQLTYTSAAPQVNIGSQVAQVTFSGLAPGFVGLYQVNAVIPLDIPGGENMPLVVSIDGQVSALVTIPIQ